jgi:hypothetical protein
MLAYSSPPQGFNYQELIMTTYGGFSTALGEGGIRFEELRCSVKIIATTAVLHLEGNG